MRWLKGDQRKTDLVILGGVFLAALMIVVIVLVVEGLQTAPSGQATGTVQATPTVDTTAVVQDQLKQQDEKLQRDNEFPWSILNIVGSSIGTILVAAAALIAAWLGWRQWLTNRQDERRKQGEERFQKVVEGLGSERVETKVGAAIMLRTFLRPEYEQFFNQAFDLAVAHLRLRKAEASAPGPLSSPAQVLIVPKGSLRQEQQPHPSTTSIPLDSLSQALITVFKESFPLARKELKKSNAPFDPQLLDATDVRLDHAYLVGADLVQAWLVRASLREADLSEARLQEAHLSEAQLQGAHLSPRDTQRDKSKQIAV